MLVLENWNLARINGGDIGEDNTLGFIEICKIFVTHDAFSYAAEPFDGV